MMVWVAGGELMSDGIRTIPSGLSPLHQYHDLHDRCLLHPDLDPHSAATSQYFFQDFMVNIQS